MDLSGAVSIGLSQGSTVSRAIDGELASAGMYKIDANGKITAVGVYFTTDVDGNRLDHEESLRVAPKALFKLTDNFILAIQCDYYDVEGDLVQNKFEVIDDDHTKFIRQEVPYKDLLVRISDGKIWCVDDISDYMYFFSYYNGYIPWDYAESNQNLYLTSRNNVYKFNLNDGSLLFEQINKSQVPTSDIFGLTENEVIVFTDGTYRLYYLWQNGGFQDIDVSDWLRNTYAEEERSISYNGHYGVYFTKHKPFIVASTPTRVFEYTKYPDYTYINYSDAARLYFVDVPDRPGEVNYSEPIFLKVNEKIDETNDRQFLFWDGSFYEDENLILIAGKVSGSNFITRLNKRNKNWDYLTETNSLFQFKENNKYDGKVWSISNDKNNLGADWLDLTSLETGFIKFNVQLPDYINSVSYNIGNGYVEYSGYNPENGNLISVYIDITTGEEKWTDSEPERLLKYLIPLN